MNLLLLETGLFQNAAQGSGRNIDAGFACNGNRAGFGWVMELPMAAILTHLTPTVCFDKRYEVFDFHISSMTRPSLDAQPMRWSVSLRRGIGFMVRWVVRLQ